MKSGGLLGSKFMMEFTKRLRLKRYILFEGRKEKDFLLELRSSQSAYSTR